MSEPTPIAELFARDPMKLSDQDLTQIIDRLRQDRAKFVLGDLKAGKADSKKKPAEKAADSLGGQMDIDDVLGDLI